MGDNEEMCYCLKAWQALPRSVQFGAQPSTVDALQATAVVDRIRRALGDISTSTSDRIQVCSPCLIVPPVMPCHVASKWPPPLVVCPLPPSDSSLHLLGVPGMLPR